MDKSYDVIIDRSSTTVSVVAANEEDASKKAYKIYLDNFVDDFESWVGEVEESPLFTEPNYKKYKATLKLDEERTFDEIEHLIRIYKNGVIEESGYRYDHGGNCYGTIRFDTPRKWSSSFIDRYKLKEI